MIIDEMLRHAQRKPQHPALIIDDLVLSWGQLVNEIQSRVLRNNRQPVQKQTREQLKKQLHNSLAHQPTVNPESAVRDQALDALASLTRLSMFDELPAGSGAALKQSLAGKNPPFIFGQTSGSTASAKLYQRTQASWIESFSAEAHAFGIGETDVILAPGALSHSLFFYALCRGLFAGATVILSNQFRPDRVLQAVGRHHATVLYSVPTQLKMLIQEVERSTQRTSYAATDAGSDAAPNAGSNTAPHWAHTSPAKASASNKTATNIESGSLRLILSSGARWFSELTAPLAQHFPSAEVIEFYGASETSFITAARHRSDPALPKGSVGKAFYGVQVSIRNLQLEICAAGEIGSVFVHSAAAFDRYLSAPPADFSEFHDEYGQRWLSVGDQGYLDSNGYLVLVGRSARKIIVSGKNLYPEEVEQALETHPFIAKAAVVGRQDARRGERLLAMIQLKENSAPPVRAALIDFLRPVLEDYKIPRQFLVVSTWPRTAAGKTDFPAIEEILNAHGAKPDQLD